MKKYLGVKLIEAKPMILGEAEEYLDKLWGGDYTDEGYLVKYEDGYESWSPKDVFEKAYRKIKLSIPVDTFSKELSEYQLRVIDESSFLRKDLGKLQDFIYENDVFKTLPIDEQNRMNQQNLAMKYYLTILVERIENFK